MDLSSIDFKALSEMITPMISLAKTFIEFAKGLDYSALTNALKELFSSLSAIF